MKRILFRTAKNGKMVWKERLVPGNDIIESTPRPWAINGETPAGWRIDSMDPQSKSGLDFLMNPVAIVPNKEDAELIVKLVNEGEKA